MNSFIYTHGFEIHYGLVFIYLYELNQSIQVPTDNYQIKLLFEYVKQYELRTTKY